MGVGDLNIQTEDGNIGMPSNVSCVIVEYLAGGALKTFLIKNRRRKLACKVVVQVALDLCQRGSSLKISYLHSKEIVHCDVKIENIHEPISTGLRGWIIKT